MGSRLKQVVIPKEKAVFWLDGRGRWHGEGGKFQHRKIIEHFHSSIRKDKQGFHLMQRHRDFIEKVYFSYEDTPLFVFDVLMAEKIELVLNTRKRIKLMPRKLFIHDEDLYLRVGEDTAKFTEQALIRLSPLLEFEENKAFVKVGGRRYSIPDERPSKKSVNAMA